MPLNGGGAPYKRIEIGERALRMHFNVLRQPFFRFCRRVWSESDGRLCDGGRKKEVTQNSRHTKPPRIERATDDRSTQSSSSCRGRRAVDRAIWATTLNDSARLCAFLTRDKPGKRKNADRLWVTAGRTMSCDASQRRSAPEERLEKSRIDKKHILSIFSRFVFFLHLTFKMYF